MLTNIDETTFTNNVHVIFFLKLISTTDKKTVKIKAWLNKFEKVAMKSYSLYCIKTT